MQCAERQAGPLPDAGGEILGFLALRLGEGEALAERAPAPLELRAGEPVEAGVELDVLPDRQTLVEAHLLAHVADPVAHAPGVTDHVDAVDLDRPLRRPEKPDQHPDRRALPRAIGAEKGEDGPRLHLDAEVIHGGEVAEPLGEAARADDHPANPCASASSVDSMSGSACSAKRTVPPGSRSRSRSTRATPGVRRCCTSIRAKRPAARAPWT